VFSKVAVPFTLFLVGFEIFSFSRVSLALVAAYFLTEDIAGGVQ
jgi:hypothetical protein